MSFPRYPAYKKTASGWLDMIPTHWGTSKLKWYSDRYSGGTPDKNRQDFWLEGTIPWLNSGAVNDGLISEPSTYITESGFANSSAKWVPPGSLVMALAGQGKTKGTVAQLAIAATTNQSMAAIVPRSLFAARFLYWWLVSHYQNIRNMSGGDDRDGLNLELLGAIPVPLLPRPEQEHIASFLDREAAKIDALVAEQEQLITLLKEKRQAVISHAVTNGLNPSVPMKDSGVEWLGTVPAHWAIAALNYRYEVLLGKMLDEKKISGNHLAPYLRNVDVQWDRINIDELPQMDFDGSDLDRYGLRAGDLLVCEGGDVGRAAIWQGELAECYYQKALHRLRPRDGSSDLPRFQFYLMQAAAKLDVFTGGQGKATIVHLTAEALRRYRFAYPGRAEQERIVAHLDQAVGQFDELINEAANTAQLLQERRSALISAAVTGQIDVRGLAADKEAA